MVDRTHKELRDEDIQRIASVYYSWRGDRGSDSYTDVEGFCRSVEISEIDGHGYILTPGRYVGLEDSNELEEGPFKERISELVADLNAQMSVSNELEKSIRETLRRIDLR